MSGIIVAQPWEVPDLLNPVRNTEHKYLKFINSTVFSYEARHFLRYGYYTNSPRGSRDWTTYWDEQERRCIEGYEVGGVRITGRHYFYLNFTLIKARPIDPATGKEKDTKKILTFPRFLDHQYYLFHELEECFSEGPYKGQPHIGMIIVKSRRKGISAVNGAGIISYNFNFIPSSNTVIGAYEASHYTPLLDFTHGALGHINKHTDWVKRRQKLDRRDHFRASYLYRDESGVEQEDGYMSEVQAISFKDNPFKTIGTSIFTMCFEEAGKFHNLMDAYMIAEPTFRDGDVMTGVPVIWGCLMAGSKVWNNVGKLVNIEDIKQEEGILGYDGVTTNKENISWIKPPEDKECCRVETTGGNYIECSNDHPLMVEVGREWEKGRGFVYTTTFIEASKLKVGDHLVRIIEAPVFGNTLVKDARLLGLMIGDGNYSKSSTPQLSCGDDEIYDYIIDNYKVTINKTQVQKTGKLFRSLGIKEIKDELKVHGMYGQVKLNKRLPLDIHKFDENSVCELLGGYFDADGNVTHNKRKKTTRVVLTSICFELLEEVKYQLIKLGIGSSIVKERRSKNEIKISANQLDYVYRLYISKAKDVIRFREKIHFLCNHKQKILDTYNPEDKSVKFRYGHVDFKLNKENKKGTFFVGKKDMQNLRYEIVTSVKQIGINKIYNLHTALSNTYIANGFITKQTGGDIERGGKDLEEMFYDPAKFGLKSYSNIYDENATGDCGWFIDDMWYYPGEWKDKIRKVSFAMVDEQGNSMREYAEKSLDEKRDGYSKGNRVAYRRLLSQQPKNPRDSFLRVEGSRFDTLRAQMRLAHIMSNKNIFIDSIYLSKLNLNPETGIIEYEYDRLGIPLREFPIKDFTQIEGCIEIYEQPVLGTDGKTLPYRYIAGIDSYDDDASSGNSVGSIIILDRLTDRIVAHYKGRPAANKFYETCRRMLKYYGATANYERRNKGIYGYLYNTHSLHLLCNEPEILKERGISKANTIGNNALGTAPSVPVNNYGLELIQLYYDTPAYGESEDSELRNIDKIRSIPLLKETIAWNSTGNFDDISAMIMLMIYREDLIQIKVRTDTNVKTIMDDPFWGRMRGISQIGYRKQNLRPGLFDNLK